MSIVAHSHGGIVALHSLRHLATGHIPAIACLATPFLHFGPQTFDLSVFQWLPSATAYSALIVVFVALLFPWAKYVGPSVLPNGAVVGIGIVIAGAAAFWASRGVRWGLSALDAALKRVPTVCDAYQPVAPPRERLLILRNVADEASGALSTGGFVEWLLTWAWKTLAGVMALPRRTLTPLNAGVQRRPWIVLVSYFAILGLVIKFTDPVLGAFSYVLAGAMTAVVAVCVTQLFLLGVILALNIVRFGVAEDLSATSFVRVAAEATPLGSWDVELFSGRGFAHSEIHEDPLVADRVVTWLLTREGQGKSDA